MNRLNQVVDRVIEAKLKAVDRIVEEIIDPVGDVGNPEKLIGKKYEQWSPDDVGRLSQVYGTGDKTPLANLVFKHIYEKVKQLEAEGL